MRKEIVENKLTKYFETICDRCGKVVDTVYSSRTCYMCEKDVCQECGYLFDRDSDLIHPTFNGDNPDIICHECWNLGESQRIEIMKIREDAEKKEELLIKEWRNKCIQ